MFENTLARVRAVLRSGSGQAMPGRLGALDLEPSAAASVQSKVALALASVRGAFFSAALFSGAINLLMLSGSLFMLQVYDRVLPSRSLPTLVALVILITVLYAFTASLELVRTRVFARIGRRVDLSLSAAVFDLNVQRGLTGTGGAPPFRDLDQLRTFLASGGPAAIFDLPWMPLFVALLFLLHPAMGALGLGGIIALSFLTWRTDRGASPLQLAASQATAEANAIAEASRRTAETIVPMGMTEALMGVWRARNEAAGQAIVRSSDVSSFYGGLSRFLRLALQSLIMALGAYLVISGKATGGVMIGSSILLGRALSPAELAIANWRGLVSARQGYRRLEAALQAAPTTPGVVLPRPKATLTVEGLAVAAPGANQVLLRDVQFSLRAGDALGVIGPSGSGKSTLARALVGASPAQRGAVRLDGSTLDQWTRTDSGRFIGYLPQDVELFAGTVGQNIARFHPDARSEAILRAAEAAGLDPFVRGLPNGFDTPVGERGGRLSAGQRQRVALARALYGEPFLLVLDEPNSALDAAGEAALGHAIEGVRRRGGVVVVIAHRPSALQFANQVLVVADGQQKAFGPRDEVLSRVLARPPEAAAAGEMETVA